MIGTFPILDFNLDENIFNIEISENNYTINKKLKSKILIEIANNKIIQNLLPELGKQ
uniref:Uncharacterized protein n=1 Tax=Meloidogyne hapla TaxID=6305 RepID=A0A1I8BH30_MELHA